MNLLDLLMNLLFAAHYAVTLVHYLVICCSLIRQRVAHGLVRYAHELVIHDPLRCQTNSLPNYLLLINLLESWS